MGNAGTGERDKGKGKSKSGKYIYIQDDETGPEGGVVLGAGLAADELGADDVADAVGDEDGGGGVAALSLAGDVGGAEGDGEADDGAEEANEGVSDHRSHGTDAPGRLPDHDVTREYGEAAEDEDWDWVLDWGQ